MTRMQAVTVLPARTCTLFFLVFQDISGGPPRAKRRTALLPPASACQIWVMSSPRDFIDDSDDYWRRDERTIKLHGPGRLRRHAPGRPPGGRDARLHHAARRSRASRTGELDKLCHDFILDHKAIPAPLGYRGYPEVDLHLDQPRGLPRHPGRQAAAERRHRQHRRHHHPRRLVRRHQPHVLRAATSA